MSTTCFGSKVHRPVEVLTVRELIEILEGFPQDEPVEICTSQGEEWLVESEYSSRGQCAILYGETAGSY